MYNYYLLLGSNLGNKNKNIRNSIERISKEIGLVKSESDYYESEPWGFKSDNIFLNKAIVVVSTQEPSIVIDILTIIETKIGRVKTTQGYESRVIDLDILLIDDIILNKKKIIIPHPRLHLRKFALIPLCDIAKNKYHPVLKKRIKDLLASCTDKGFVKKVQNV